MDFLSSIDPLWVAICCGLLCIVGFLALIVLPIVGGALDLLGGIFELVFGILEGGPIAWCGCLLFLAGCGVCAGILIAVMSVLSTCDTPNAVNFCRLF